MLGVPADPSRERSILVILVHRREIAPLEIAARDFRNAGFEVDAEPLPQQEIKRRAHRRPGLSKPGPESTGREKEREETCLEQHSIRLIPREFSRGANKRKKTEKADDEHPARPNIEDQQNGGSHANPANRGQHVSTARKP